jgi:hypothetical protein
MTDLGSTNRDNTLNAWFRNTAFTTLTAQMQVSLHSGDPGTSGTAEIGGSSYARQNVTFAAPSGGAVAASAAINFTGMPSATGGNSISGVGVWAGAQYQQGGLLTGGVQAVTQGNTFTLSSLSCSLS